MLGNRRKIFMFISHIRVNCYYYLQHLDYHDVWWCFVLCFAIILMQFVIKEKHTTYKTIIFILIASIYLSILLSITLLGRERLEEGTFAETESSIKLLFEGNVSVIFDVLFNVLLFIPAGILLSMRYRVVPSSLVILCLTIGIEIVQAITNRGRFEVVDIVTNFLGGLIGIGLFHLVAVCIKRMLRNKRHKMDM